MKVIKGENDLATVNPKLADEWDYIGNGDVTPSMVTVGSNKKVAWIGKCGHRWVASIKSRNSGTNCPYCSGNKVLPKYNDLDSTHLELVKEWDFERNVLIRPTDVSAGSHKKVWWKCSSCGYSWKAEIKSRALDNKGCPCCAGNILVQGINDLLTVRPDIAKEWDYEKNEELRPEMFTSHSDKIVYWRCKKGHIWRTSINHRVSGSGCPKCASGKQTSFPEQAIFYYISNL